MAHTKIEALISRDGNLCHYCRCKTVKIKNERDARPHGATREHVVPRSKGGTWDAFNLVVACRACNEARGNNDHVCTCIFCQQAYILVTLKRFNDIINYNTVTCKKIDGLWVLNYRGRIRKYQSWKEAMRACRSRHKLENRSKANA